MTNNQTNVNGNNRSTIAGIGLLLVFGIPLVGSYLLYMFREHVQFNSCCHGILFSPPLAIQEFDDSSLFMDPSSLHKWQMVVLSPDVCDDACQVLQTKYDAIHIALGKDKDRVYKYSVSINKLIPSLESIKKEPGIYIIDPKGWLILFYPASVKPKDILTDIRRLLRLSHVG